MLGSATGAGGPQARLGRSWTRRASPASRRRCCRSSRPLSCTRWVSTRSTASPSQTAPDGSASATEVAGALAVASVAPVRNAFGKSVGTLVSLDMLKHNDGLRRPGRQEGRRPGVDLPERRLASPRPSRATTASAPPACRRLTRSARRSWSADSPTWATRTSPTSPTSPTTSRSRTRAARSIGMMFTGIPQAPYRAAGIAFTVKFILIAMAGLAAGHRHGLGHRQPGHQAAHRGQRRRREDRRRRPDRRRARGRATARPSSWAARSTR